MGRIIQFLREVRVELKKVVWPTRQEAFKITFVVIIFSVSVALFLGLADLGLSRVIEFIAT